MAKKYISKLVVSGETHYVKDQEARDLIEGIQVSTSGGIHYVGETSTALKDGDTTTTLEEVSSGSLDKTTGFVAGDLVIYGELEFIWNGKKWHEFGSTGSLKKLAFKDSASGDVTPAGTISVGSGATNYTPSGSNEASAVTLTGGSDGKLVTQSITPAGAAVTVHDTPSLTKEEVKTVDTWSAGTMFTAEYDEQNEQLTFTAGAAPTLSTKDVSVGTDITAGAEKSVASVGNPVTVATGQVDTNGAGSSVVTVSPTGGTAAAQKFNGTGVNLAFNGNTTSVTVE